MHNVIENVLPGIPTALQVERRLVRDYVRGDAEALRTVDGWIDVVLRSEFVSLVDDWDDLRQEVRLRVLANLRGGQFRGNSELRTYVHRIAKNAAIDHCRRLARRRAQSAGDAASAAHSLQRGSDAETMMSRELLHKLILELSPEERRLLTLVHVECLSYVEVAKVMGVAVGTVKARVFRCRERLIGLRRQLLGRKDS